MQNYNQDKDGQVKVCSCCGQVQGLRSFAYLSSSAAYHDECNRCVTRKAIRNRSEVSLFVQEYGMTPKVFQSLRKRAEKIGYRRTQELILAKLNDGQKRRYWFSFTINGFQDHAILLTIVGMLTVAFAPIVGLSFLGIGSIFLIWTSLYKRTHQDPVNAAINFYKQVHIETSFLELKKEYHDRRTLPQLPRRRLL